MSSTNDQKKAKTILIYVTRTHINLKVPKGTTAWKSLLLYHYHHHGTSFFHFAGKTRKRTYILKAKDIAQRLLFCSYKLAEKVRKPRPKNHKNPQKLQVVKTKLEYTRSVFIPNIDEDNDWVAGSVV